MRYLNKRIILIMIILVSILSVLNAGDSRVIPLDLYLIIDSSSSLQNVKDDALGWLNSQVIDRILMEGDNVTVWSAGNSAQLIYSGEISSVNNGTETKTELKEKLNSITGEGRAIDFSGALSDLRPRLSRTQSGRLPYTMMITASAGSIQSALTGSSQSMLKWFRTEKSSGWQAFVLGPDINEKVSRAASDYMNSQR